MSYIIKKDIPIVFIHIPKTAGASVINSFSEPSLVIPNKNTKNKNYHSTIKDLEIFSENSNHWKFTVVRNPWHRVVSWYTFRKRILELSVKRFNKKLPVKKVENNFTKISTELNYMNKDFNLWLQTYIEQPWDFTWFSLAHDQYTWLEGSSKIDKVFKFETLKQDFEKYFKVNLPHKNKSKNNSFDWRSLYNQKGIDIIKEYYKRDIELFDYSFS